MGFECWKFFDLEKCRTFFYKLIKVKKILESQKNRLKKIGFRLMDSPITHVESIRVDSDISERDLSVETII